MHLKQCKGPFPPQNNKKKLKPCSWPCFFYAAALIPACVHAAVPATQVLQLSALPVCAGHF
eukprot:scaffold262929_cov17-Tisochrysis_lutea.AAC.2